MTPPFELLLAEVPARPPGAPTRAAADDIPLVAEWHAAFQDHQSQRVRFVDRSESGQVR
jgi:hypothetical protein